MLELSEERNEWTENIIIFICDTTGEKCPIENLNSKKMRERMEKKWQTTRAAIQNGK